MPRYFIDVIDGDETDIDDKGVVLRSVEDAKALAARVLIDLIEQAGVKGSDGRIKVILRDENGVVGEANALR